MQVFVTRGGHRPCSSIDLQLSFFETGFFAWARTSRLQNWPGICGCIVFQTLSVTMCSFCMGAGLSIFIIESSSLPSFFKYVDIQ